MQIAIINTLMSRVSIIFTNFVPAKVVQKSGMTKQNAIFVFHYRVQTTLLQRIE